MGTVVFIILWLEWVGFCVCVLTRNCLPYSVEQRVPIEEEKRWILQDIYSDIETGWRLHIESMPTTYVYSCVKESVIHDPALGRTPGFSRPAERHAAQLDNMPG